MSSTRDVAELRDERTGKKMGRRSAVSMASSACTQRVGGGGSWACAGAGETGTWSGLARRAMQRTATP